MDSALPLHDSTKILEGSKYMTSMLIVFHIMYSKKWNFFCMIDIKNPCAIHVINSCFIVLSLIIILCGYLAKQRRPTLFHIGATYWGWRTCLISEVLSHCWQLRMVSLFWMNFGCLLSRIGCIVLVWIEVLLGCDWRYNLVCVVEDKSMCNSISEYLIILDKQYAGEVWWSFWEHVKPFQQGTNRGKWNHQEGLNKAFHLHMSLIHGSSMDQKVMKTVFEKPLRQLHKSRNSRFSQNCKQAPTACTQKGECSSSKIASTATINIKWKDAPFLQFIGSMPWTWRIHGMRMK